MIVDIGGTTFNKDCRHETGDLYDENTTSFLSEEEVIREHWNRESTGHYRNQDIEMMYIDAQNDINLLLSLIEELRIENNRLIFEKEYNYNFFSKSENEEPF